MTNAPAGRLDSLTGLRWFAAFLVFCYHFSREVNFYGSHATVDRVQSVFRSGPVGVSFFYILSGFVLAWSTRAEPPTTFWRRRFARIYPSHFATFLVAAAMLSWFGERLNGRVALANLTLTQAWVPNDTGFWYGFNGVSWSLSCEFFFYLCFPLLVEQLRRLGDRGLWAAVIGCNLLVLALPLIALPVTTATGWRASYFVYTLPATRILEFILGIALACLVRRGAWRGPGLLVSCTLALACIFGLTQLVPQRIDSARLIACTVVAFTLTIPAAASADLRGTRSWLRHRHLVYLGEVSFAFYLVHEMVIFAADHVLDGRRNIATIPAAVTVFSIGLVCAMALHEYVEKPLVRLLNPRQRAAKATPVHPARPEPVARPGVPPQELRPAAAVGGTASWVGND